MSEEHCEKAYQNGSCMWSKIECKFCGKIITKIAQYYKDRILSTGCCSKKCYKSWELEVDKFETLVNTKCRQTVFLELTKMLGIFDSWNGEQMFFLAQHVIMEMK